MYFSQLRKTELILLYLYVYDLFNFDVNLMKNSLKVVLNFKYMLIYTSLIIVSWESKQKGRYGL
jgi:hypothetical protein